MLCVVTLQPEDDDLDPYEAWAHDRLTLLLGPLRRIDRRSGPNGLHDFKADLGNGHGRADRLGPGLGRLRPVS